MIKFVFLFFLNPSLMASPPLMEIWQNNQAVDMMTQGKVLESHEQFVQLLGNNTFEPIYQYNLGASFIAVEEIEKAKKMFEEILKLNPIPAQLAFVTNYNLCSLYSLKEGFDVEKSLKHYQAALAFQPDSVEIKTNIELLIKQQQGGGQGKDKKDNQDKQKGENDKEQPKEPQEFTNKPQPNQFDSKDMSKQDVKKILEELKKQEQRIRAKHDRKGGRQQDRDKNW